MKKLLIFLFIIGCSVKSPSDFPVKQVHFEPQIPSFKDYKNYKLAYISDNELPLVKVSLILRGGTFYFPADESLKLEATGDMLRGGGTLTYTPDELDLLLEKYSANISSDLGSEFTTISLTCLESDLKKLFPVFAEVAMNPRFDLKRIHLWKGQAIEGILRRKDDSNTIAGIAFNQVVFGENQIGNTPTVNDVNKIKRIDLVRSHRKLISSKDKVFLATGSVSQEDIKSLIDKYFTNLNSDDQPFKYEVNLSKSYERGIYYIEGNFQQTAIIIGQPGIRRLNPDDFKILSFNGIFGSDGFASRLMQEVRSNQGLVYGIYGGMTQGSVTGKNLIIAQTKTESTGEAVISALNVLDGMRKEDPTNSEMEVIRLSEANSFVFNYASQEGILSRFVNQFLLGYPKDYDQTYLKRLNKVELGDIRDVANKYWDLSKLVVILVGNSGVEKEIKEIKKSAFFKDYPVKHLIFDQKVVGQK